jgi:membrane protease subunit (stomatin/prohibitin family)
VRLGNFVVSITEEDEQTLKTMYKDAAQIRMAGGLSGFQQLAAGKAMMGAGEGMARGDGGGGGGGPMLAGAGLGMGMAMANMFSQASRPAEAPAAPAPAAAPAAPSLQDRLKKLKMLKEEGLIDDQEYAAKRAEILKDV